MNSKLFMAYNVKKKSASILFSDVSVNQNQVVTNKDFNYDQLALI